MTLSILITTIYFTHFSVFRNLFQYRPVTSENTFLDIYVQTAASSGPELLVMQYPEDASVLDNSPVWMLLVFEYPSEEDKKPVVYWRKSLDFHNQQNLQSNPSTGRAQAHIIENILRGFFILKLSNIDQNISNSYFCDVMLTEKIQGKPGKGTKLTVHGFKCKDCIRSDEIWWSWLVLGYTIFVTTVIITFGIHQCCTKCKNESRDTDSSATLQSEWISEQPPRPVNNGFNQEYEDMSITRALGDTGRKMI